VPNGASCARSSTGGTRSTSGTRTTVQLKANLFVTMQEEIGTARRMVRVSRDALTSELLWALLQCGDNCLTWEEHELPSGRFCALRQRRRHCVVDLPARGRA
jgi:hypothetical protein